MSAVSFRRFSSILGIKKKNFDCCEKALNTSAYQLIATSRSILSKPEYKNLWSRRLMS